jgi:hypothetical protein
MIIELKEERRPINLIQVQVDVKVGDKQQVIRDGRVA